MQTRGLGFEEHSAWRFASSTKNQIKVTVRGGFFLQAINVELEGCVVFQGLGCIAAHFKPGFIEKRILDEDKRLDRHEHL
jgi:hypothetical protein